MKYYEPKFLAYLAVLLSCLNSLTFPMFGMVFSDFLFIIIEGNTLSTYTEDRDRVILYFLAIVISMGILGCLKKYIFNFTGENLTYKIRSMLFESLIYK